MSSVSAFNTPLETGIRTLIILVEAFPAKYDLNRLVEMDYLVVHSGDYGGPESLHAPLPMRSGELLVRRSIIEKGILLMISRMLILRSYSEMGILYSASESAHEFTNSFTSKYLIELSNRASWVVDNFGEMSIKEIRNNNKAVYKQWYTQFYPGNEIGQKYE